MTTKAEKEEVKTLVKAIVKSANGIANAKDLEETKEWQRLLNETTYALGQILAARDV